MTILVKNEADIIEANLELITKFGVDHFVIMDNNSTDGNKRNLSKFTKGL